MARVACREAKPGRARLLSGCREYAYKAARRLGCSDATAEDLAQDTVVRLMRLLRRERLRPATLRALLDRTVFRLNVNRWRRRSRESTMPTVPPRITSTDYGRALDTKLLRARVRDAVSALPPGDRKAVWLRHAESLSCRDIGQVLRTSRMTVWRRLKRAERTLRGLLLDSRPRG